MRYNIILLFALIFSSNCLFAQQTLKLTSPNGGEVFSVGGKTEITWEGVEPTDTCKLEYSFDNGKNWKIISKTATGLKYSWENIPQPISDSCLLRISKGYPEIVWEKTYGGGDYDNAKSIIESSDGYYVVAGWSSSDDGDLNDNIGYDDFWVIKIAPDDGSIVWQKNYGGSNIDRPFSIIECNDGSYVVSGFTISDDGDVTLYKGLQDCWLIKINSDDGSLIWEKTYGGSGSEVPFDLIVSKDGSLVFASLTSSNDGDVSTNNGHSDCWIVKINPDNGSIIWEKTYGGSGLESALSIIECRDGSFAFAGSSTSTDVDIDNNKGGYDYCVFKVNSSDGSIQWQKTYGGSKDEEVRSIIESSDDYFVISGWTESNNGDIIENKGDKDYWILKISSFNGSIQWQQTFGGSKNDESFSIIESNTGSYIVAGYTHSIDGLIENSYGATDYWIFGLDPYFGTILWQKCIGGTGREFANSLIESSDGSYVAAGQTYSKDGDISELKGKSDAWVVKLSNDYGFQSDISDNIFSIKNGVGVDDNTTALSSGENLLKITPNPNGGSFEIEFNITELGATQIYISDVAGNKVKELYSESSAVGFQNLSVNADKLPSGMYFIIMQTPTGKYSAPLNIVK